LIREDRRPAKIDGRGSRARTLLLAGILLAGCTVATVVAFVDRPGGAPAWTYTLLIVTAEYRPINLAGSPPDW
jgi:hypothetical protein